MVYKTKPMVGVPSLTTSHMYLHRHLTPPLHLQHLKYINAQEHIFLSYSPCAYRYKNNNKNVHGGARILIMKFKKNSVL